MSDNQEWWRNVDPGKLDRYTLYSILSHVIEKYGRRTVLEEVGISRVTLWRLLRKESPVKPEYVKPLLKLVSREEFEKIVTAREKLRSLGILGEDGSIDYSLALEILAVAKDDIYLKNALLNFVVREFPEDLKRMLSISMGEIEFKWDKGFEEFLTERKKRRKIKSQGTLSYYRTVFRELEGKRLSKELVDFVVNHRNPWIRNVFRHYVRYLYYKGEISPEKLGWIMEVVPSRTYKVDVRPYPIELDTVRKTMGYLGENHPLYYLVYRIMIESGARLSHVLLMLEKWSPSEIIEIPRVSLVTDRLVCTEQEFCRYYMGLRLENKPCEWIYFSTKTLELIGEKAPIRIGRHQITKYAERNNLLLPKYARKFAWRLMVKAMNREVAQFIQSRTGELHVSDARYGDLLSDADKAYPKYLKTLFDTLSF